MRGILFQYDDYDALVGQLNEADDEQAVVLPDTECFRDGEWLLATFAVGQDCVFMAACSEDRGAGPSLSFANHDWDRLRRFAEGRGPSLVPASSPRTSFADIMAPPGASVLVVDDDDDLHDVLGNLLRSVGFGVGVACSAEEALDRMRSEAVDLLVLDWNLPGMSGIEFCARLRQDPRFCRLPVVLLSARSCACDLVEALAAGADDFVSKPFRHLELGARIISLLRRSSVAPAAPQM